MNNFQYIQYECLKTELKEEYEKRMNVLHKRMEQKPFGPYQEAQRIFMRSDPLVKKTNSVRNKDLSSSEMPRTSYGLENRNMFASAKTRGSSMNDRLPPRARR